MLELMASSAQEAVCYPEAAFEHVHRQKRASSQGGAFHACANVVELALCDLGTALDLDSTLVER